MATVNVYLNFQDSCEEAFNFYKSVFGGEFSYIGRYNQMPAKEGMPAMSAEEGQRIMHISLPISNETTLMGCDMGGEWAAKITPGNNFSVYVDTKSKEEADRLFKGLSVGGKINMNMENTFWGSYFGMLTDKYGINWMIAFE